MTTDAEIRDILTRVKTIAVVGLSPRPERPSYRVSRSMQSFGYRIVPVRPAVSEVLGEKAYPRLSDMPFVPDLVDVFRASHEVAPIVDECIALGVKRIWLQDGVIDEAAAMFFERRVNEAIAQGAKLLEGNRRRGALYSPTVLDQVTPDMLVAREETFGPVSPIIRFKDIDQAIAISNGTAYGLSSAVCTNRMDYITRFINELQVGSVNVREVPGYRLELTPFGGIKDSGLGYKEGVQEAMKSFTNLKTYSLPWL